MSVVTDIHYNLIKQYGTKLVYMLIAQCTDCALSKIFNFSDRKTNNKLPMDFIYQVLKYSGRKDIKTSGR